MKRARLGAFFAALTVMAAVAFPLLTPSAAGAQCYNCGPVTTTTTTTSTTVAGGATTTTSTTITGSTTTVGGNGHTGTQDGGTHNLGDTFTIELCGFVPGSTVTLTTDAQPTGSQVANSAGCVIVTIKVGAIIKTTGTRNGPGASGYVLAAMVVTQGAAESVSLQVDGIPVVGVCGANTLTGQGQAQAGGTLTQTANFTINCAATAPHTSNGGGGLAFTGANLLRLALGALVLLGFGGLLLAADRRRSRSGLPQ